ncbi:MAG: hypothetical protein CMK59_09695, partial [Proteobacteria bacterium]|nr:hypothetical protein [Pseudomonadota bacterium]
MITELGKEHLIKECAYIWFVRLCALRFINVSTINTVNVPIQPEIKLLEQIITAQKHHTGLKLLFKKSEPMDTVLNLLAPELLGNTKILKSIQETLTPELCQDVEILGWLHQFYILEQKEDLFSSKKKIATNNIPTATQIFT